MGRGEFEKHGQVVDVNILRKPDGRMVGCGFVEFKKVVEATEALKKLNATSLLGRTIAVDWAVPKEMFNDKKEVPKEEVKEEEEVKVEIKEEEDVEDEDDERVAEWGKEDEDEEEEEDEEDGRNLPQTADDSKLRGIMGKAAGKAAKITECKVMRDLAAKTSKEYAFVTFASHQDALTALRNVNNNPSVFTNDRRPIVEFAIENRKALLARQKRLEKSREKNPNMSEKQKKLNNNKKLEVAADKTVAKEVTDKNEFSGMTADPKQKGLPTHSGAKVRTNRVAPKISRKDLRKREEERKNPKLKQKRKMKEVAKENQETNDGPSDPKKAKKEKRKEKKLSKEAQKEHESEKRFTSLVSQYKTSIQSNVEVRKKWFE